MKNKTKWTLTAVGFFLVAVVLVGICLQVFGKGKVKPSEWFTKPACEHVYVDGKCEKCGEAEKPAEDNKEENKDSGGNTEIPAEDNKENNEENNGGEINTPAA